MRRSTNKRYGVTPQYYIKRRVGMKRIAKVYKQYYWLFTEDICFITTKCAQAHIIYELSYNNLIY